MRALVIGGTGPTGPYVVNGLCERGYEVVILHTGRHEVDTIPAGLEHVHTDPFDPAAVEAALAGRTFDVACAMYGRLRELARILAGRVGKFVSVGGVPVYRGYGSPRVLVPPGLRAPTREDAAKAQPEDGGSENLKVVRIVETEDAVFKHHPRASHVRYPLIYGPSQLIPREWMIVRRILDGRRKIILPDGGLFLRTAAYSVNAAQALLLTIDRPDASAGQAYTASDEWTPTLRQVCEIIAGALGHDFEIVDMPYELATPGHPLMMLGDPFHRFTPSDKLVHQLGYRDVVPVEEALSLTARWLAENPVERGGLTEKGLLQDRFSYDAEDRLIEAWERTRKDLLPFAAEADPLFVDRYSPDYETRREARRASKAAHKIAD
jgi:nucleoside-diphosphate-sugar epimerase